MTADERDRLASVERQLAELEQTLAEASIRQLRRDNARDDHLDALVEGQNDLAAQIRGES